jgi:hypothetical protein
MTSNASQTTQVYEIYIQVPPQANRDAITKPEWTEKHGYKGPAEYEFGRGGAYRAHATKNTRGLTI